VSGAVPEARPGSVAVLLVSHDGARWLPVVVEGLRSQTHAPDHVVCVDTGSRDEGPDLLERSFGAVRSLPSGTGFPEADLLGPKLREWPSLRRLLEVGVTISATGRRETGLERGEYDQGQHDDVRRVLAVHSAGLLVRRAVLEELGGFDDRLPLFGNDLDLGWRAAAAGRTTLVVPQAVVFHAEAAHRGVRRTALTGRHTHFHERRGALYTLLANTGQLSLAHGGLMGVGAFMTAVASTTWEFPFFFAFGVGVVSTAAVAFVLGVAALRVRGLYLAVLTLSFAVVLEVSIFPRPEFSQGGAGLQLARPAIGPFDLADDRTFLGAALVIMAAVWLADRRLQGSPLGRAWVAVRDNRAAASARGISPAILSVAGFTVSGIGAGVAGALFALRIGHLVSLLFPLLLSFTVVLYVVLGGIGSRIGVAIMTALFTFNTVYGGGGGQDDVALFVGAALLLVLIGFRPDGVAGLVRSLRARIDERRRQDSEGTPDSPTPPQTEAPAPPRHAPADPTLVMSGDAP